MTISLNCFIVKNSDNTLQPILSSNTVFTQTGEDAYDKHIKHNTMYKIQFTQCKNTKMKKNRINLHRHGYFEVRKIIITLPQSKLINDMGRANLAYLVSLSTTCYLPYSYK